MCEICKTVPDSVYYPSILAVILRNSEGSPMKNNLRECLACESVSWSSHV